MEETDRDINLGSVIEDLALEVLRTLVFIMLLIREKLTKKD